MVPIPVVSIVNIVVAFVSFGNAIRLRFFPSHEGEQSVLIRHFSAFYFYFGVFFLLFAVPGIFSNDLFIITVTNILAYGSLYFSLAQMAFVPFSFLGKPRLGSLFFYISVLFGAFFMFFRFFNFHLSKIEIADLYVYWRPDFPVWLRVATGVISGLLAIISASTFLWLGYKNRADKLIYGRSIRIGSGLALLLLATASSFIFAPTAAFFGSFFGGLLSIMGLGFIYKGISYKISETSN